MSKYGKTSIYGDTKEGPLGIPMLDNVAKDVESIIKLLPSELKGLLAKGPLRKSIPAVVEPDKANRTEVSVVTMGTLDRDFEIVEPRGIDWSQWTKNPVVTWNHNYNELPPARGLWVKYHSKDSKDGYIAKSEYINRPTSWEGPWFADAIWHYVSSGYLPGKSIGFVPLSMRDPTAEESKSFEGIQRVFTKTLALEYAVCPVQSNPDAMLESIDKGIAAFPTVFKACGLYLAENNTHKSKQKSDQENKTLWFEEPCKMRVVVAPNKSATFKQGDILTGSKESWFDFKWLGPIKDGYLVPINWDHKSDYLKYQSENRKNFSRVRITESTHLKDAYGIYRYFEKNTIVEMKKEFFFDDIWGQKILDKTAQSISWDYWKLLEESSGAENLRIKLLSRKALKQSFQV